MTVFLILFLTIAMASEFDREEDEGVENNPYGTREHKHSRFDLEHKSRRAETLKKDMDSQKTEGGVFNNQTLKNIGKLGSNGFIDRIEGTIATGKEADVFQGQRGDDKIAIKIFRLTSGSYFRNSTVLQYILGDKRFTNIPKNPRGIMQAWTLKEFRNLKRVEELGINAPRPLAIENNVIVMEFIGEDKASKQMLRYDLKDAEKTFKEVIRQTKVMYKGKFVHADMSEYNILMFKEEPYFIDFGQGVLLDHPKAQEFLERDMKNICNFFRKRGVDCDPEEVLKEIRNA